MESILDYLNAIIKERKRRSQKLDVGSDAKELKKSNSDKRISLSLSSINQSENESDRVYKFRLETEAEELEKFTRVVETLVIIHKEFLAHLNDSFDDKTDSYLIGNALHRLNEGLLTPYTTYAVIALSGVQKTHLALAEKGDHERTEFIMRIANKYVTSSSTNASLELADPEPHEWEWYLQRPNLKINKLTTLLKKIYETGDKPGPEILADNRRIRMAGIKMDCTYRAIMDHLKKAGKEILE